MKKWIIALFILAAAVAAHADSPFLTAPWIKPKPTYFVATVGMSADENNLVYLAAQSWNRAIRFPLVQWSPSHQQTNIILVKWPVPLKEGKVLGDATPGPLCFVRIPAVVVEVVAHEIGHCLGLDDRAGPTNIMQPVGLTGTAIVDPTSAALVRQLNPYLPPPSR